MAFLYIQFDKNIDISMPVKIFHILTVKLPDSFDISIENIYNNIDFCNRNG